MSGQRAAAAAVLDSTLAGRVEPWQAHLWVRKLQDLRQANAGLSSALQKALDAAATAQTAEDQALVRLQHVQDLQVGTGPCCRGTCVQKLSLPSILSMTSRC